MSACNRRQTRHYLLDYFNVHQPLDYLCIRLQGLYRCTSELCASIQNRIQVCEKQRVESRCLASWGFVLLAMGASSYLLVVLVPLALAVWGCVPLVRGQPCGVMIHAEPGEDFASLMAKTFANFQANCRAKKEPPPESEDITGE